MKLLLMGYGRMGRLIESLALEAGHTVALKFDVENAHTLAQAGKQADVVMDFSAPAALPALAAYIRRTHTPLLSGTTGCTAEERDVLCGLGAYAPVLYSANYSIGVALLRRMLARFGESLMGSFDAEIVEAHHGKKADAPSGTAKLLYEALDPGHAYTPVYGREGFCGGRGENEIGIHALRGGTTPGTHTVSFFGQEEELSFTHRALSRAVFVSGALKAAELLSGRENGFYTLDDLLFGGDV